MDRNLSSLPPDLPIPEEDGACEHLMGSELPDIILPSTGSRQVNLRSGSKQPTVFFFYPRTGRPEEPAPKDWDLIPYTNEE